MADVGGDGDGAPQSSVVATPAARVVTPSRETSVKRTGSSRRSTTRASGRKNGKADLAVDAVAVVEGAVEGADALNKKAAPTSSAKRSRAARPDSAKRTPLTRSKRPRADKDASATLPRGAPEGATPVQRLPAKDKEEADGRFPFSKQEDLIILSFAREHLAALEAKPDDATVWQQMPLMYDRSWMV